jgi:threonine aldolase
VPELIELRSDTFSLPTPAMYAALGDAPLGDDVYEEDATVKRLEELAAERTGKEAALLVASGTQGNLVSLLSHCPRGAEVIVGASSDLYNYEVSGMSAVGGLMPRSVDDASGYPPAELVDAAIRPRDEVHAGPTGVICVENSHQRAGGRPLPMSELAAIADVAEVHRLPLHMDGARVFNAAVALGLPAHRVVERVDSVTFCLSKGLSCPIGSVVCGRREFIAKARRVRKMVGGGMRQAGWIAAAGIVGLEQGTARLSEDHANAKSLALGLSRLPGVELEADDVLTNIVYFEVASEGATAAGFVAALEREGVRALAIGPKLVRMVTHRNVDTDDVHRAILAAEQALERAVANSDEPDGPQGPYAG